MWSIKEYDYNEIPRQLWEEMETAESVLISEGVAARCTSVFPNKERIMLARRPIGPVEIHTDDEDGNHFPLLRQDVLERAEEFRLKRREQRSAGLWHEADISEENAKACDRSLELSGGTPERRVQLDDGQGVLY